MLILNNKIPEHQFKSADVRGLSVYYSKFVCILIGIDSTIFKYIVRIGKAKDGKIFYNLCLEVDGKVPRAKRTSLIKSSTSKHSIHPPEPNVNTSAQKNQNI